MQALDATHDSHASHTEDLEQSAFMDVDDKPLSSMNATSPTKHTQLTAGL